SPPLHTPFGTQASRAAQPARPSAPRAGPATAPLAAVEEPPLTKGKGKSRLPRGAIALIVFAAVLAVTAGVVAFLWQSPKPMRAEVALDDRGTEVLALGCDDCVDGTIVTVGQARATFQGKKAQLALSKPLDIGKNNVLVGVHRPGIGRDEEIVLNVAVDYRVRGVLTSLSEDPPKIKVPVQPTPPSPATPPATPHHT